MVIMLILHFIANVMKGVYNFVKGKVFGIEPTPVEGKEICPGEGKGKGGPEEGKSAEERVRKREHRAKTGSERLGSTRKESARYVPCPVMMSGGSMRR